MMRLYAAVLLTLLASGIARGQGGSISSARSADSPWRIFTPDNSPFPDVSASSRLTMAVDTQGVGWIVADGIGACSFDGETWRRYDTLGIREVLTVDSAGGVWFRIDGGVARLRQGAWRTYTAAGSDSGLTQGVVTALRNIGPASMRPHLTAGTDLYGNIWFNCRDSLVSRDSASWKVHRVPSGPAFGERASMVVRLDGQIFLGRLGPQGGPLRIYNPVLGIWSVKDAEDLGLDSSYTLSPVGGDVQGAVWFETVHHPDEIVKPARIRFGSLMLFLAPAPFTTLSAVDIGLDQVYWVATPDGLVRAMNERYTTRNSPLPADSIVDVACDRRGGVIWALTRRGLALLDAHTPVDSTFTGVGREPAGGESRLIDVRPTSTRGPLTILRDPGAHESVTVSVMSLLGAAVARAPRMEPGDEPGSLLLDLSPLPAGRYFVRAVAGDRVQTVPVDIVR